MIILLYTIPIFSEFLVTAMFNVSFVRKAFKLYQQIRHQTRLPQNTTSQLEELRQRLREFRKNIKPILTLLTILLVNTLLGFMFIGLNIPKRSPQNEQYYNIVDFIVTPNMVFIDPFLHLIIYRIYFKEIRQAIKKLLSQWYRPNTAVITPL